MKSPVFIFFSKVDIKPAGEGRVGKNLLRNAEDEEIWKFQSLGGKVAKCHGYVSASWGKKFWDDQKISKNTTFLGKFVQKPSRSNGQTTINW